MADNQSAMEEAAEFLREAKAKVDGALDVLVPGIGVEPRRLHEAIRWSLFAGGKRIRPAIVFASGRTFNASFAQLTATAAAIEMIHTYSLIHDDLPAMDDDDLRRGKPTCHKQFDEATAILAGDVLQTLAFGTIASDQGLSAEQRTKVIAVTAAAAGTPNGMVAGQQLDLEAEGQKLTLENIEQIHLRKTGALISAAATAGAIIGDAADDEVRSISEFSKKLGLLFQITDDLLDVTEATESLGKTAGKDVSADKATYPRLLGIDGSHKLATAVRDNALAELDNLDRDTVILSKLTKMVLDRRR
jgi:geranylgeranyl pyrophosphate synthase